jgi:fused signal recognition particle receptor
VNPLLVTLLTDQVLIAIIAVVVVLLAGTAGLVVTRRHKAQLTAPKPVPLEPAEPAQPAQPSELAEPEEAELLEPAPTPTIEKPESAQGRLVRLRARLARSQGSLGKGLLALLSRDTLDEEAWDDIETTLITADVGVKPTQELVERLRTRVRVEGIGSPEQARGILREELVALVNPDLDRSLKVSRTGVKPAIVLVVGVNGTGKTTTVGKLARVLVAEDKHVVLGAADTFRAAAADQLQTWGERVGVRTVRGPEGGDPASVAFDSVRQGIEEEADVVLVDTAGRLHTQEHLMEELSKVRRVIAQRLDGAPHETLLTIDATTGQNGLQQARLFTQAAEVTGLVLTKLDGSAKGGIAIAIAHELGLPIKLIGMGESLEDLRPFDAEAFARALFTE